MSRHTPGPWTLDGPSLVEGSLVVYAEYGNGHFLAEVPLRMSQNQRANAELICQAPQMYDNARQAVRNLRTLRDEHHQDSPEWHAFQMALESVRETLGVEE